MAAWHDIFERLDANTARVTLGTGSFLIAVSLFNLAPTQWQLPTGSVIRATFPAPVWGTLFLLHALGVLWRQLDKRPRLHWAFAINALGLLTWFVMAGMKAQLVRSFNTFSAIEFTMVLVGIVALVRTGQPGERFQP